MVSGVIFDVEGTLVDSVPQNLTSLQDALQRFGHAVSYETLHLYSGLDGDQTLQLLLPGASGAERERILKAQGDIYERHYLESVKPITGVRDVFEELARRGVSIALATDCKGLPFRRYLSLIDADAFISATAAGTTCHTASPIRGLSQLPFASLALLHPRP